MNSRLLLLLTAGLLTVSAAPALALNGLHVPDTQAEAAVDFPKSLHREGAGPQRLRIAQLSIAGERYIWSAEKSDGEVSLSGNVPNPAIKSFLAVRAGGDVSDESSVADGGPDNFIPNSLAGLDALNALTSGRVSFSGSKWTLSGYVRTRGELDAVTSSVATAVEMDDWVVFVEVSAPEAIAEVTDNVNEAGQVPELAPELLKWSVTKSPEGRLTFDGSVPHQALQNYLAVRAGAELEDNSELGGTPPPDFIASAVAAVDAAKTLQSGRVAFTGSKWTIGGYADSRATLDGILADLAGAVDISDWVVFIEVAPDATASVPETPADSEAEVTESAEAAEPEFQFNALKSDGGDIALSGNVPSSAFGSFAGVIAGGVDADALQVRSSAPESFISEATAALRALTILESGLLAFENGQWSLIGDALSDADAAAVSAAITDLPDGDRWTLDIAVIPVFQWCADVVANFSDTHTILFAPGSSNLTPESADALAELAGDLVKCPAADLHIEGHTDADGPEDSNMALSVSRAEAVIAQLIELGLDDRRLYAIGYGETLPVATNDTVAGKAQNRRIVFELVR